MARPKKKIVQLSPMAQAALDLRVLMGLTQSKFADLIGIALNSVARYECGLHEPSEHVAIRFRLTSLVFAPHLTDHFGPHIKIKQLSFGDTLSAYRRMEKQSREKFSQAAQIEMQELICIEDGTQYPTMETVAKIAAALEAPEAKMECLQAYFRSISI